MRKPLNQKTARRLLEQHGWRRTVGGKHNDSVGLSAAILRQAGIDPKDV